MPLAGLTLREMRPDELILVETIHAAAFDRDDEARLPAQLIGAGHRTISVVALKGDYLVGHALFSELGGARGALALAPVAVVPDHQNEGVGSAMIRFGLDLAKAQGWRSVFVLGAPEYYGRFGFRAELARRADVPWAGPHFQALELEPGSIANWTGALVYPEALSEA